MTIELFRNNSYLKEHDTTISEIVSDGLVLNETIFYPEGGGQPGDEGSITINNQTIDIIGTRYTDNKLVHVIENIDGFKKNEEVKLNLNWIKRYSYMKVHTCLHLLCSIIPFPVTGGSIGDGRGRLDFDLETKPDKEEVLNKINELINKDYLIHISSITDKELDDNPDLVRTMAVKPPRGSGQIRMIRIGDDIDFQPCGGTHVSKTSEINHVKSVKIENKGKMNKRIILKF
jgi:misacylated tRNA(Ala) deacylase|tara:strand:- start:1700 stop:2392 length:693 start_codon:yes stop_codon:yes gene_type:complete